MHNTAIKVEGVVKDFVLRHKRASSVKSAFINVFTASKGTIEKQHVLKDISFEVKKGEFFGIVGRNGSGKSTLLKILAGIYHPNEGVVQVDGKLVSFIELGVGFNPELTGRENVYLNGAMLGFSNKEVDGIYDDIVGFAELERFMDQKLKNYSSGMQVRLAFSMAIRADADILVLDEILAVGDEAFQRKCSDYFNTIKEDKSKTIILVTHDMDAVRKYCDRALFLSDGEILTTGTADEVSRDYSLENIDPRIIKSRKDKSARNMYIFGTPQHGNLGDIAIIEATRQFVADNSNLEVIEIPAEASYDIADTIKTVLSPSDIIAWHGGGNIGTLWPNEERIRLDTLSIFSDRKIISFPQSVFFDPKDEESLAKSREVYNSLTSLTMFVREQKTLDFVRKNFTKVRAELVPDMVFLLKYGHKKVKPSGAITLFRSDKERRPQNQQSTIDLLSKKFERVTESDTVIDVWFNNVEGRGLLLRSKLDEIASHELVVTDRLHGMIFAYITGTPCVVFENSYYKIRSTYDSWLKDCEFIKMVDTESDVEKAVDAVMKHRPAQAPKVDNSKYKSLVLSLREDDGTH